MQFRPLGERVLLKKDAKLTEVKTAAGIIIPETTRKQDPVHTMTVVAIGNGIGQDIFEGDRVMISEFAGTHFKFDGQDLVLVSIKDIMGVVNDQA